MMSLLVVGWSYSDITHYDAASYANTTTPILDRLQGVLDDPQIYIEECVALSLLRQVR